MTDFEKNFLELTKKENFKPTPDILEMIDNAMKNTEVDEIDKAALYAVASLRMNLEDKEKEPQALWRFVRYLTEVQMPLRFIDFTYMLFPDNEKYYANILTPTALSVIKKQAIAMLENEKYENDEHKKHLEKIVNGQIPYGYSIEMPSIGKDKEE